MDQRTSKAIDIWLSTIGARGGKKKTKAQTEARKANAAKARKARAKKREAKP